MPEELPGDASKKIWQNQPTETPIMTLEAIRKKATDLRAKTRRQLLGTLAAPLTAAFLYAFVIREFPSLERVLRPLCAFALAWSLAGLYFLNRGMWSVVMPGDAGLSTGLEFCRREIERRHYLLSRVLLWSFAPILLAIGTLVLALALIGSSKGGIFPNGIPFLALVIVWIIAYFVLRLKEQRKLKRELDELNAIARENR